MRDKTLLAVPMESQAEEFAWGLPVDEGEISDDMQTASEIAEYFGIPVEIVRTEGKLIWCDATE